MKKLLAAIALAGVVAPVWAATRTVNTGYSEHALCNVPRDGERSALESPWRP